MRVSVMARPWPVPQSWRRHGFWPGLTWAMHPARASGPGWASCTSCPGSYLLRLGPPAPVLSMCLLFLIFESLPFLSHARLPKQEAMGIV